MTTSPWGYTVYGGVVANFDGKESAERQTMRTVRYAGEVKRQANPDYQPDAQEPQTPRQKSPTIYIQDIFEQVIRIREVERSHKQLARLDLLMRQQPSWTGLEMDMAAPIPAFLMAARLPEFEPNIEPLDSDPQYVEAMVKEAAVLPPKPVDAAPKEVKRIQRVVDERPVTKKSDAAIALERLITAAQQATERFSVVRWREADPQALTIQEHVWLVFAVMALRSRKCMVEVVASPARMGERFRHQFHDAMVVPKGAAGP